MDGATRFSIVSRHGFREPLDGWDVLSAPAEFEPACRVAFSNGRLEGRAVAAYQAPPARHRECRDGHVVPGGDAANIGIQTPRPPLGYLCRPGTRRCWSGCVSVLVDDAAEHWVRRSR